jgi:predicted DsbA family dithiol-disulfide isomerase
MHIDIISDVVCPWCYIGKRNLEKALSLYEAENPGAAQDQDETTPTITWHPFQLNPDLPVEGMPRDEYTSSKFGGPERAREIYARVASAGTEAGIDFRFDDIGRQPNTVAAHQLILLAADSNVQDGVVESLFKGYFLEGRDLTDRETLLELAERGGLAREDGESCLAREDTRSEIEKQDRHARSLGVEGVPFFIFNQKLAVSGAQPPDVLVRAMTQAESEAPVETNA